MATGARFLSVTNRRLLGTADFRDRILDYLRDAVGDVHRTAYGLDGVFNGDPIVISAFGANRIQLSANHPLTSDGDGHFLRTDTVLAGRDVGIAFENTNAVVYHVGLHYAERPRGIQINPRSGFPEFMEMEETIGNQADPNSVTLTGGGTTLTFRVDSVCQPFGGTVDTHAGRLCLVWKKVPGRLAITEALAVELRTVVFTGGQNLITTTGLLGQADPNISLNAADYFVTLLGPTISSSNDLAVTPAYVYVGNVTGNAGTPTVFDMSEQNDLSSGFAVDLNAVTRLDVHGDLKIRVRADASDADEIQLEVQSAGGTSVFNVDEDGDVAIAGTATIAGLHVDDAVAEFDGGQLVGADINAGTTGAAATTPRRNLGTLRAAVWNEIDRFGTSGAGVRVYVHGTDGLGVMFLQNATFDGTNYTKTTSGRAAWAVVMGGVAPNQGLVLKIKAANLNGAWTDAGPHATNDAQWNVVQQIGGTTPGNAFAMLQHLQLGAGMATALGGAIADSAVPMIVAPPSDVTNTSWVPFSSHVLAGAAGSSIYIHADGRLALVRNAAFTPATPGPGGTWAKNLNNAAASRLVLDGDGFTLQFKEPTVNTAWADADWGPALPLSGDPSGAVIHVPQSGVTTGNMPELHFNAAALQAIFSGTAQLTSSAGDVSVDAATEIALTAPEVTVSNDLVVVDDIDAGGDVTGGRFLRSPAPSVVRSYGPPSMVASSGAYTYDGLTPNGSTPAHVNLAAAGAAQVGWNLSGIPNGAQITRITFFFFSPAGGIAEIFYGASRETPTARNNFTATPPVSGAGPVGAPSTQTVLNVVLDTAAAGAAVDNNTYKYVAQLGFLTPGAGTLVYNCEVEYTLGELGT